MKPKIIGYISVAFGISLVFGILSLVSSNDESSESVFHVTLANPDLYTNGIYYDSFEMAEGHYQFHFISNGDSPQTLRIMISGPSFSLDGDFELEGNLQNPGISEYYTWDYTGPTTFWNSENQQMKISIDPKGNLMGPVSVDIISI